MKEKNKMFKIGKSNIITMIITWNYDLVASSKRAFTRTVKIPLFLRRLSFLNTIFRNKFSIWGIIHITDNSE